MQLLTVSQTRGRNVHHKVLGGGGGEKGNGVFENINNA